MKLSECIIGTIIIENFKHFRSEDIKYKKPGIGYIIGLVTNSSGETIPLIRFSHDLTQDYPIHNSLIDIYTD
jgi:hypothetical protein